MPVNAHQISISRRNLIIAIVVFLAMNVFVFFMGITVGRHGRKYQAPVTPPMTTTTTQPATSSELDNDLAYFEERQSKERETPVEVDFLDEETLIADEEPEAEPEVPDAQPEPEVAEVEVEQPKIDPGVPGPDALGSGFWIQVLAIGELNSAKRFERKLNNAGFTTALITESGLYKVQVGPFEERPDAATARQQINDQFQVEGWIRKR